MGKTLTQSDLTAVNDTIESLSDRIDRNVKQIFINSEIRDNIIEVAGLPKKLQETQFEVLKIEHNQTEQDRRVEMNNKRINEIETMMKRSDSIQNEVLAKQETGELTF